MLYKLNTMISRFCFFKFSELPAGVRRKRLDTEKEATMMKEQEDFGMGPRVIGEGGNTLYRCEGFNDGNREKEINVGK